MPTIAVVDARASLSRAIASRFVREGYTAAIIASQRHTQLSLVAGTAGREQDADWYWREEESEDGLSQALDTVENRYGSIDVLVHAPSHSVAAQYEDRGSRGRPAMSGTQRSHVEKHSQESITAITHVLPGMLARGQGTVLAVTGADPLNYSFPHLMSELRNFVLGLHGAYSGSGVYVAHVDLITYAGGTNLQVETDKMAAALWQAHQEQKSKEVIYPPPN
jgi:NADP-dependent 3-hydroxy acid dehydrogenase YdfG